MTEKTKVQNIFDLIQDLSIVELHDLVKMLEEAYGVSASMPVVAAGVATPWVSQEEEEKTSFTVELKSAGPNKIAVIKIIREITGLGLKEWKDLADKGWVVKENVSKEQAEEIKQKLAEAGATVEIK